MATKKPATRAGRRAGESTTRSEILTAARTRFAESGYDATSLRAIGSAAGVDPALIVYFFGSKQDLFIEALELPFEPAEVLPLLLEGDPDQLGYRLARFMSSVLAGEDTRSRIVAVIRSAGRENAAAELIRVKLTRELLTPLAAHLGRPDAELRASLAMSQIAGLTLARHVVGLTPLTEAGPDRLVAAIAPTLQRYLAGDLD